MLVLTLSLLNQQLVRLGLVMMKVDVFAFGGGFAAVPLMFREIVDCRTGYRRMFSWTASHRTMTPGPIVITATFVGCQVAGLAGALVGTVCIFLPSFFAVVLASLGRGASLVIPVSEAQRKPSCSPSWDCWHR